MPSNRSIFVRRGAIALIVTIGAAAIGYGIGHTMKRTLDPARSQWDDSSATKSLDQQKEAGNFSAAERANHLEKLKQRLLQQ